MPFTAHFAIGSGTKLAFEDAIELTRQFDQHGHDALQITNVLNSYQEARRIETLRLQMPHGTPWNGSKFVMLVTANNSNPNNSCN